MQYSPILALVTGGLEVAAGLYALLGPGRKAILRPIAILLFQLAAYQFAEVAVCSNPAALAYSRLAYVIITWLPPSALSLVVALDRRSRALRTAAVVYYAAAAALCAWILVDHSLITLSVCHLVLARYFPTTAFAVVYALFYQSGLLWLVFGSGRARASARDAVDRKQLTSLQMGVLGFMIPSIAVRVLTPGAGDILPSVMCHFAVIMAASFVVMVSRERRLAREHAPA
jgi:hypothetical protein